MNRGLLLAMVIGGGLLLFLGVNAYDSTKSLIMLIGGSALALCGIGGLVLEAAMMDSRTDYLQERF